MLISVSIEDKTIREKVMWAEKNEDDSFICPKCKNGNVSIVYKNEILKKGLRCGNCKAKYSINLML